jgi:hypothetical protein
MRPVAGVMRRIIRPSLSVGCATMASREQDHKEFKEAAKVHHQVLRSDPVTFNYRPTPPSGPAPKAQPNTERPERAHRTKKD